MDRDIRENTSQDMSDNTRQILWLLCVFLSISGGQTKLLHKIWIITERKGIPSGPQLSRPVIVWATSYATIIWSNQMLLWSEVLSQKDFD